MQHGVEIARTCGRMKTCCAFWSHKPNLAPWQSDAWVAEMERTLRPAQFQRLIVNRLG
jgi:hypothetical protein